MRIPNDGTFVASSFSGAERCVEVGYDSLGGRVLLRDSENPQTEPFAFSVAVWNAFIEGVKAGEFDVD